MLISADVEGFAPSNFEIFNFYEEEMCFAWSENNLVVFPYVKSAVTSKLQIIVAPRKIRNLRCFVSRVFVICEPVGIYKLLRTHKLSPLSSSGIANGPTFYEVFIPENNWLLSQNKSTKANRELFQLEDPQHAGDNLQDLTLSRENSTFGLCRAIHKSDIDEDICLVSSSKRLFKITQNDVQLIYRSDHEISNIVPILCNERINGIILVTGTAVILVHATGEKLNFEKVYLDGEVRSIAAGIDESNTIIWLAHVDGMRIHYWQLCLTKNTFRKTGMEYKRFIDIKNYKSKRLVCLTDARQILEVEIDVLGLGKNDGDEFFVLKPEMLRGTDKIVNEICERTKELQSWIDKLLEEQEKLRRINLFSHKMKIVWKPDVKVERIAGKLFVRVNFVNVLPMNCRISVGIKTDRRLYYCSKKVEETETMVDVELTNATIDASTRLRVDLITLAQESKAWCLIRDATIHPKIDPNAQNSSERSKFINDKLAALRRMVNDGTVDINKLVTMKKSIRRELKDL